KSRNQRGKPPASKRIVDLGPVHDPPSFRNSTTNDFLRVPSCPWWLKLLKAWTTKDTKVHEGNYRQFVGTSTYERSRAAIDVHPSNLRVRSTSARRISSARTTPAS